MNRLRERLLASTSDRSVALARRRMSVFLPDPRTLEVGHVYSKQALIKCEVFLNQPSVVSRNGQYRLNDPHSAIHLDYEPGDHIVFHVVETGGRKSWVIGLPAIDGDTPSAEDPC